MKNQDRLGIKVCGMRDPQNLEQLCELAPEYVGFIFYPPSKRFVGSDPDRALFEIPGAGIKKAGVFVNEDFGKLINYVEKFGLEAVQLHGEESREYCERLSREPVELIKALNPALSGFEVEKYLGLVDLFLFDSAGTAYGGSGQKFDWSLLEDFGHSVPFLLSGGIGPGDAVKINTMNYKGLMGVDINSRFELSPGMKDVEAVKKFITEIRK